MSEPRANESSGGISDFDAALERCRPRLTGLLRSRRGGIGEGDLEDILQETFARALRLRERFESGGDDGLFRWLSSIALNVTRELDRARPAERLSRQAEPAAGSVTHSRAVRRQERFDRLQNAIDELPDEYREVMILTRIEGVPVKEVAERLGKTPNAISRMLLRATRKLRDSFGDTASLRLPPRRLENRENRAEGSDG